MSGNVKFQNGVKTFATTFSQTGKSFGANMGNTQNVTEIMRGATFIPSVSAEGVISWTNDADLTNPAPVNVKGEKGEKGDPGATGAPGADGKDGVDGKDGTNGVDGSDGVGIKSVSQTTTSTADDGNNVITVTLTNGTKSTFKVQNGSKGSTGATGADGKTPVKGTDYWTASDKAQMVSDVIAALPVYDGSVVSV